MSLVRQLDCKFISIFATIISKKLFIREQLLNNHSKTTGYGI